MCVPNILVACYTQEHNRRECATIIRVNTTRHFVEHNIQSTASQKSSDAFTKLRSKAVSIILQRHYKEDVIPAIDLYNIASLSNMQAVLRLWASRNTHNII
jgi:hypothetical protein